MEERNEVLANTIKFAAMAYKKPEEEINENTNVSEELGRGLDLGYLRDNAYALGGRELPFYPETDKSQEAAGIYLRKGYLSVSAGERLYAEGEFKRPCAGDGKAETLLRLLKDL